jgi:hypothetical protein
VTGPGPVPPVVGLVCCAAGGVEEVRTRFVEPALARGWQLAITLTPTAATWLHANGEAARLAAATGLPVRSERRLPWEPRPHPVADCWVVVPATANTVASLALGLTANQALTSVGEAIGAGQPPVVIAPWVGAANAGHPAWPGHLATLRSAGVRLVDRDGPGIPWDAALTAVALVLSRTE